MNGTGSSSMSGIAPIPHRMAPIQVLSYYTNRFVLDYNFS